MLPLWIRFRPPTRLWSWIIFRDARNNLYLTSTTSFSWRSRVDACRSHVDRVGFNEARPGIWVGCRSHVQAQAQLKAPCWIGQHVFVGPGALIGPGQSLKTAHLSKQVLSYVKAGLAPILLSANSPASQTHWPGEAHWSIGKRVSRTGGGSFFVCDREPRRARSEGG